jgi:hypothetical protein
MKANRLRAITLILALALFAASGSVSYAAVKANSSCAAKGKSTTISGKVYLCQLVGKKLIWLAASASATKSSAAVSNPASTTTTSTTATTSTPEPAHLDAPLDANNWLNFRQLAGASVKAQTPATNPAILGKFEYEDSVPQATRTMSQEQMDYLLKYYSGYLGAGQSFDVIDVATQKWGYDTIMNHDPGSTKLSEDMKTMLPRMNHDNPKCDSSGTMAGGGFSISYLKSPTLVLTTMNCPIDVMTTMPHEFTHAIQSQSIRSTGAIDPNPGCYGPAWLREGQAQVGAMTLSHWGGVDQTLVSEKGIISNLEDPSLPKNSLTALEENDAAGYQEYDVGAMASLYLVARSGWAKSVQVWNVAAQLEGNSCNTGGRMAFFNKAFQQVYGQDLASFYAEVTPVLKHIYDDRQAILLSSDAIQPAGTVKIQLTESCHGYGVSSTLQRLTNGQWLDIASGLGWAVSSCAGKYLPWTYATVVSGDQLRWHVFVPGVWDWYSTPYRYSL